MAKRLKSIEPASPAPKKQRRRVSRKKTEEKRSGDEAEEAVEEKGSPLKRDDFRRYCDEIGAGQGLLTPTEELELAKRVAAHLAVLPEHGVRKLVEAAKIVAEPSSPEGQARRHASFRLLRVFNPKGLGSRALLRNLRGRLRAEDQAFYAAFATPEIERDVERFVRANLRLVISIARRFHSPRGMTLMDLIQHGNLGLMKGVLRYDWRRGFRFSTYASWWIRHAIQRALADEGRTIRIPVHMSDLMHKIERTQRQLTAEHGRPATDREIAEAIKVDVKYVRKAIVSGVQEPISLHLKRFLEDGDTIGDTVPDDTTARPDAVLETDDTVKAVHEMIAELRPIEQDIIRSRFGIGTDVELTLEEIGDKYDLSRERIRQLQEVALKKLRRMAKYDLDISA